MEYSSQELAHKYDRFARWYDWVEGVPELLGLRRLRRRLLQQASGRVLEVAVGTGKNLRFYPEGCRITALDVSPKMLGIARRRAAHRSLEVTFVLAAGERLPFPDNSFDIVGSSLTTCTFPDPVAALNEMGRVCRTEGKILLLEHGRSNREWLGRWQDRRSERHAAFLGCHWNREPLRLLREAGLKVTRVQRTFFGVFHAIEVQP